MTAGDLNIYHARTIADQQITYILEFAGRLDRERLRVGLSILFDLLPILSCRVKVQGNKYQWIEWVNDRPSLTVSDASYPSGEEILSFASTPCDPERQPSLKVLLIPAPSGDTLCIKIDHVLSDASGLKYLLYLFAEAYSQGTITQPVNPDRGFFQVFRTFSLPTLVQATLKAVVPKPGPALKMGPFELQPLFIEHICLDPQRFDAVHRAAKQSEATLNDLLLAAVYQSAFKRLQENAGLPYPVMVPVDMRRYLPEEKRGVIGNLASAVYPRLSIKSGELFPETLERVKASMEASKQNAPGLSAAILMNIAAFYGGQLLRNRYRQAASRGSRFINLTNFGIIDQAQCNFGGLQPTHVYGVGPVQYAPGILIAVSTYRNHLHLVVQGNDSQKFQYFVQRFLTDVGNSLQAH